MMHYQHNKRGFTVFFAMLVGGLALAVGFSIYDLMVREIDLSGVATQSQYAIYAADTGVECALYWDSKYGGSGSAFGTSTGSSWGTGVKCNDEDISANGTPFTPFLLPTSAWQPWVITSTASAATTTFTLAIPTSSASQAYCAVVQVGKATIGGILYTNIISRGYNNCLSIGVSRIERTLKVNY